MDYSLLIVSSVCCVKCEGRASYPNPCYLTTSRRSPNQVNIYLYGDVELFCFHFCYKTLKHYFSVLVQLFTFSPKIILECKKMEHILLYAVDFDPCYAAI